MEFIKYILSRGLPKTGQVIESRAGDDGTYEAGWWLKLLNATNRTRFVVKTIGGDVVVFDRATGLCWAADGNEAGCNSDTVIAWVDAIDYALALDFAGFTDWRLPNINELFSIADFGVRSPSILEPPFSNTNDGSYWSSTTLVGTDTMAFRIVFSNCLVSVINKTSSVRIRCVRSGL